MKCILNGRNVKFEELEQGAVFEYEDNLFLKLDESYKTLERSTINAVRITLGEPASFFNDCEVRKVYGAFVEGAE